MIRATATFRPSAIASRLGGLFAEVKVFAAVQRSQGIVADVARSLCPVATGGLQDSIQPGEIVNEQQQIVGSVVAESDHASFVEFGTGLRGAGTYPYELPTEGVPKTGEWIYDYRNIGWKGMPSQPFMRPALDQARSQVLEEFKA